MTVPPEGYYVVFGSRLGSVGFVKVTADGTVWGLSRYPNHDGESTIRYRTLGVPVSKWLADQLDRDILFVCDRNRTGWVDNG